MKDYAKIKHEFDQHLRDTLLYLVNKNGPIHAYALYKHKLIQSRFSECPEVFLRHMISRTLYAFKRDGYMESYEVIKGTRQRVVRFSITPKGNELAEEKFLRRILDFIREKK